MVPTSSSSSSLLQAFRRGPGTYIVLAGPRYGQYQPCTEHITLLRRYRCPDQAWLSHAQHAAYLYLTLSVLHGLQSKYDGQTGYINPLGCAQNSPATCCTGCSI